MVFNCEFGFTWTSIGLEPWLLPPLLLADYYCRMISKKLLIKDKMRVAIFDPPQGFALDFPQGAKKTTKNADVVLLFAANQAALKKNWRKAIVALAQEDGILWVAYPKISSKMESDITRDKGWDIAHKDGFDGVSICSLDPTWSAFRLRHEKFRSK